MAEQFLSFDQAEKTLSGVIKALPVKRPLLFLSHVVDAGTVNKTTVNFDRDMATKNVLGQFWSAEIDAKPATFPTSDHVEYELAYTKELVEEEIQFDNLNKRQIGQPLGVVNVLANQAAFLVRDMAKAEERIQNLQEWTASQISIYGGYVAQSEAHPKMVYDFQREKIAAGDVGTIVDTSTSAAPFFPYKDVLIPSVNLTTVAVTAPWGGTLLPVLTTSGSFTAGDKTWNKANIDSGKATPYLDVQKMIQTCNEWDSAESIVISANAYHWLNYDLETNYKDAASTIIMALRNFNRQILPPEEVYQGVTFQRNLPIGAGISVYTYNGVYDNPITGERIKYMPDGWVLAMPRTKISRVYGIIKHKRAGYRAMPRFFNTWRDEKSGGDLWEIHSSFAMSQQIINAQVAWKVC